MTYRFTNWGRNYTCEARELREPRTDRDVARLVQQARRSQTTIRAVGAGHSWSDIVCNDGFIVRLDHMDRILNVDHERNRVRVQAGKRLKHLNVELKRMGLALSNLGSVAEQSIAGATATGTHGTGLNYGVIASAIRSLTLINGLGEIVVLEEDDARLAAARVGLGALGIITEVELQLEPAFNLEERIWKLPFDQGLEQMPELVQEHEHIKFWWMPHTDDIACFAMNRTEAPAKPPNRFQKGVDTFLNDYVFDGILKLGNLAPSAVPPVNRLVAGAYFKEGTRVDQSDQVFTLAMPPVHLEVEYGIPAEHAAEMLSRVRNMVIREDLRITFIQEVRFVAADDIWLSNANERNSCQFGGYMPDGPGCEQYFDGVARIAADYNGRPHWGKDFKHERDQLAALYPHYEDFEAARRAFDPEGIFANDFIRRCFTL